MRNRYIVSIVLACWRSLRRVYSQIPKPPREIF